MALARASSRGTFSHGDREDERMRAHASRVQLANHARSGSLSLSVTTGGPSQAAAGAEAFGTGPHYTPLSHTARRFVESVLKVELVGDSLCGALRDGTILVKYVL
jgi:hypothetical protein